MTKRVLFGDTIQNVIDYNGWTISLVNGPLVNEIAINEKDRNDNWQVLYKVKNTPAHKLHAVAMAKEEIDKRNASMSHADFSTLVDMGAI
jgi:hypothetical protein